MDKKTALEKIKKWYRILGYSSIVFAFITFLLWLSATGTHVNYFYATPRIWACFIFTLVLLIISVSVRKIYLYLSID